MLSTAHRRASVLIFLVAFVGVASGVALTSIPPGVEQVPWWPAAGISLLVLLWCPRRHLMIYSCALIAAQWVPYLMCGPASLNGVESLVFSVISVIETVIIALLMRPERELQDLRDFKLLILRSLLGVGVAAVLTTVAHAVMCEHSVVLTPFMILGSHLVAILLIVPLGQLIDQKPDVRRPYWELLSQTALLMLITAVVFRGEDEWARAWVPIPILVWSGLRLGTRWTALELVVVSLLVQSAIRLEIGPFTFERLPWEISVLSGQTYSLALIVSVIPLALTQKQHHRSMTDLRERTEQLLTETRLSNSVLAAIDGIVMVMDDEGRILSSNATASRLTGYKAEELAGFGWTKLTPPEFAHDGAARLASLIGPGATELGTDIEIIVRDGGRRRMRLRSVRVSDEGQGTWVLAAIDVTAERNSAGWLWHTLKAESTTAIIGCDLSGQVILFSRGAEDLTGHSAENVMGSPITELFVPYPTATLSPSLDELVGSTARDDGPTTRDWWLRSSNPARTIALSTSEIADSYGARIGFLLVAQDVTEARAAETKMAQLDAAKDEFVSTASHEIRTPMTSVIGYTEILSDGLAGELTDEQRSIIEAIARNGHRLLNLADELLIVSRLDAETEMGVDGDFDLRESIAHALQQYEGVAAARGIELSSQLPEDPIIVRGRESEMQRVFLNLLSNAVKFSTLGGIVECAASFDSENAVVRVSDRGIGIPAADLPTVFDRFFRSDNAIRGAVQGSGLGLSIVATVVDQHAGRIEVESAVGEGAVFTVTLPLSPVLRRG